MLAYYVHNLNPIALRIYHEFALRWYGLAYLLGFVCGFLALRHLARRKLWVLAPEKTADFIAAAALFGVFIGGRLGYILLYSLRAKDGVAKLSHDPLMIFRVWEGGMASHGGILGLVIFTWFYSRKHKVSWTGLGDGLCVVAPLGLMFGRIANFINGELFGRITTGVPWAVKFPLALSHETKDVRDAAWNACVGIDPNVSKLYDSTEALAAAARENPTMLHKLAEFIPPRHPSQIYEALLEGGMLFTILWVVRVRFPKAPDGLLTGLFFALYASFRIFGEQFREPDADLVGPLTMGQFLSFFMFLFAAGFFVHAWRGRKTAVG